MCPASNTSATQHTSAYRLASRLIRAMAVGLILKQVPCNLQVGHWIHENDIFQQLIIRFLFYQFRLIFFITDVSVLLNILVQYAYEYVSILYFTFIFIKNARGQRRTCIQFHQQFPFNVSLHKKPFVLSRLLISKLSTFA